MLFVKLVDPSVGIHEDAAGGRVTQLNQLGLKLLLAVQNRVHSLYDFGCVFGLEVGLRL